MSSPGHAIMVLSVTMPKGEWFDWHVHPDHQFAWAAQGMLTVQIGDATWVLPPSRALWIPAGTVHRTGAASTSSMHSVYFGGRHWADPTVVAVGPLLAELIHYLADLTLPTAPRRRGEAVLRDLLVPVPVSTIHVPAVSDRLALIARGLTEDPADDRDLAAWGRLVGASSRTLARAFLSETGMTFGTWRTQIRLLAALPLLAAGMPVATTARRVGYATPSAFVAAFRRVTGTTPGTYFS
ncbi:AraC family transcriptional regulator [Kutzneria sp. NPDC052558]|uniref:AraC family transcriptional regulator n=1 Tax=Kutzneria sp. NPDC052558 TaxID=3364121 RepID=UPI0037C674AC